MRITSGRKEEENTCKLMLTNKSKKNKRSQNGNHKNWLAEFFFWGGISTAYQPFVCW